MDWLTIATLAGGGIATASGWIVNWWTSRADRKRFDKLTEASSALEKEHLELQHRHDQLAHQLGQLSKDYARERKSYEGRIAAIRAEVEDLRARADRMAEHMPTRDLADALARVLSRTEARDPGRDTGGEAAMHGPAATDAPADSSDSD
jgi:DNA anti-recombination protein RmuC